MAAADFAIACLSGVSFELDFDFEGDESFVAVDPGAGLLSGLLVSSARLDKNADDRLS